MKKIKKLALSLALAAMLGFTLSACNSDNNDNDATPTASPSPAPTATPAPNGSEPAAPVGTLQGTYISELNPFFTMTFTGNHVVIAVPLEEIELGELEGNLYFRGSFRIDEAARRIHLSLDMDALIDDMVDLVWRLLETDPDIAPYLDDPEVMAELEGLTDMLVAMFMMEMGGLAAEFEQIDLRFGDNFDRLYSSEDGVEEVFVRQ